jgi:hypothetical protein
MKGLIVLLLSLGIAVNASAQKCDDLYADIALNRLGMSVTYDHRLSRHFELGGGVQLWDGFRRDIINGAVFLDLRPYWQKKKNLFFVLADVGLIGYFGDGPYNADISRFGAYTALGVGYSRIINRRGMGPYASFALKGGSFHERYYYPWRSDYYVFEATGLLSIGFKF